ncbi:elongin-A2 isoform X1 [Nomascus leucogenys]|uniref:elongin-A2 isoform X1 n=1 Tax=Nomascus leucogenys TaxID=61853 RepID=UPI00122D892E|nr:elongin-A2 isoform X1 [Nomascus leucogenys]
MGYIRPSSGTRASFCVGQQTAEVTPGCGSISRGTKAGLLSCVQGPAPRNQWPTAPRTELAPGCDSTSPGRCLATGQRGPATPDFVCPAAPRTEPRPPGQRRPHSSGEMAAGSTTLRAVEKLQVRLATKTDPRKLEKYLQKLSALPMTADILAETGIRKAVKRLRKHQHVGDFARDLAARWKKLVLVDRNTGPDPQDPEESASRQRFGEALQDQEKARGFPENATAPRSPSHSPEHRRTARRTPPGQQRPHPRSPSREPRAERKRPRMAPADSGPQRAPPTRTAPLPMPEGPEPVMRGKQPGRGHAHAAQVGPLLGPGCQGKPQGEAVVSHSKEYKSSRQEKRPLCAQGDWHSPTLIREKSCWACLREETPRMPSWASARDRPPSDFKIDEEEGQAGIGQRVPALAEAPDSQQKRPQHRHSNKKRPSLDGLDPGNGTHSLTPEEKEQLSNHKQTQEGKPPTDHLDRTSVSSLSEVEEVDMAEEFEQPTLSFEKYLTYDEFQKQKKKTGKSSTTALGDKQRKANKSKGTRESWDSAQKSPPVQESQSERLLEAGADSAGPKTVPSHGFSELWHLSEAWMQANYDQLSDCDSMNFQAKPEALCAPKFQEEAALPGRRVNAKMQVYSGSRTACQPQVLTLRQQCVRVLRNNPDAISDVGEVPYWVLGPILEGWSPDQLYRREKDNHALIRETDELWRIHCLQDYKEEKPQEHESWRELYLRLPDAREQRLRVVTTNIRSARENNPNSREAKIICFNSLAKTSHDASRRKEKSAGAADPGNGEIKPAPKPAGSSQAPSRWSASGGGSSSSSVFHGLREKRANPCQNSTNEHRAPAAKTRKQAAKKVAPLMAKAVRDYKRRFSRR